MQSLAVGRTQRKNSLRLCAFARKKIKYLEEEKFKLAFTAGLPQVGFARNLKSIGNSVEFA